MFIPFLGMKYPPKQCYENMLRAAEYGHRETPPYRLIVHVQAFPKLGTSCSPLLPNTGKNSVIFSLFRQIFPKIVRKALYQA
jgi:hypothetical protein